MCAGILKDESHQYMVFVSFSSWCEQTLDDNSIDSLEFTQFIHLA